MNKVFFFIFLSFFIKTNLYANTWKLSEYKDEFRGTTKKYVISNSVNPNKPLDFPYQDLVASFYKYCGNNEMIGIMFSSNLSIKDTVANVTEKYTYYLVDVKLDENYTKVVGANGVADKYFRIFSPGSQQILNSKIFKIQFNHYNGKRHYTFDLSNFPTNC
tara:strand:+ start:318 stop:800 length:483 start_codon:yes stop_codon:yes gene_type:complete